MELYLLDAWFVTGSAQTKQLSAQQPLGCVYAQGASLHIKSAQNKKSLKTQTLEW